MTGRGDQMKTKNLLMGAPNLLTMFIVKDKDLNPSPSTNFNISCLGSVKRVQDFGRSSDT